MSSVDWHAAGRGALLGLVVIVPIAILFAVLDRSVARFADSGWAPLFALAIIGAYVVAGVGAGRLAPDAPLTNGALAGLGALLLWIPLRLLIWVLREDAHGLLTGHEPVFTASRLLGQAVMAVAFGILGALFAARGVRRSRAAD